MAKKNEQAFKELDLLLNELEDKLSGEQDIYSQKVNDFLKRVRDNLEKYKFNASGNLSQSLRALPIKQNQNGVIVTIELEDYWESLEKGQPKGTKVKLDDIIQWMINKEFVIKPRKSLSQSIAKSKKLKKKLQTLSVQQIRKKIALAIVKTIEEKGTIKRFGYKGKPFLTEEIPQLEKDITQEFQ